MRARVLLPDYYHEVAIFFPNSAVRSGEFAGPRLA
jgi:hypothetical protein